VFSQYAIVERITTLFEIGKHIFTLSGQKIISDGWFRFYDKYLFLKDKEMPQIIQGEIISNYSLISDKNFKQPPSRYNQSSLLDKMEQEEIGTKATRADIIKTLIDRGYIAGNPVVPTEIAFTIYEVMKKYCPRIISPYLTRKIERYLQKIEKDEISADYVIHQTANEILESVTKIKKMEKEVGNEISKAIRKTQVHKNRLGICPECENGYLTIIRSKKTRKRFVGCSNYRNGCSNSAPLPQKGKLIKRKRSCPTCGWPILLVRDNRISWKLCINIECESKE